ncbi:MAG TPA: hypothetical protein VIC57_09375 [Candidatus Dormibacteraeota bacterium]
MSDVNQKCVSLADGTLSPDLRVNYEFGLVLGVDDFRQEQLYFLEKEYLYNRALHGYGTVYGLKVRTSRPPDNAHEVVVQIEPGLGLDQWGRPIVLRNAQCARLGAWLAKQEQQQPGIVASRRGVSGDLQLYVVATYDECSEALVPLPGQPCSSSESTQAPSRIRDSFNLELRWEPPSMPAWDAVRKFADLLAHVRFEANLPPGSSDEPTILALVRGLDQPGPLDLGGGSGLPTSPPLGPGDVLRLPAETAREALDRIFTVWTTEVRASRLQPDLTDPEASGAEAGILLARIDCVPDEPLSPSDPRILDVLDPDDTGRPFLLHTQLIQELMLLNGQGETAPLPRAFATLAVTASRTVQAWLHHPAPLVLPTPPATALTLLADGQPLALTNVAPLGLPNLFALTVAQPAVIAPGARIELRARLDAIHVQNGSTLADSLPALGFDYADRDGLTVSAFAVAGLVPASRELVTFNTLAPPGGVPRLALWFHTDSPVRLPATLPVARGVAGAAVNFAAAPVGGGPFSFQWELTPPAGTLLQDDELVTIVFDTNAIHVGTDNVTLTSFIGEQRLSLVGYDGGQAVRTFYEVHLPPQVQSGPTIDEVIDAVLKLPGLPFVTITPDVNSDRALFELWFHLDVDPTVDVVRIADPKALTVRVFAEVEGQPTPQGVRLNPTVPSPVQHNVFRATLNNQDWTKLNRPPYLRFVFGLDTVLTTPDGQVRLGEYIQKQRIKFDGHNGGDTIVAYVRVPGSPQG